MRIFLSIGDQDQLASEEAKWSGSALFVISYVNLYQQSGSMNLIGWQLEMGVASWFLQHDVAQRDKASKVKVTNRKQVSTSTQSVNALQSTIHFHNYCFELQ